MVRSDGSGKRGWQAGCLALACALPGAAWAQTQAVHPLFLPTRDVSVTYSVGAGPGQPAQLTHMYYTTANGGMLRIDTPNGAGFTVLDRAHNSQMLVITAKRIYATMPLPPGTADGFILNDTMTYTREGQQTIAGYGCTSWKVATPGTNGQACVTNDGVLLSGSGGQPGGPQTQLTASVVAYAPQSPGLFTPPPGFKYISQQQMQQMLAPPGGYGGPPPNGMPPGGAPPNGTPPYPPPPPG